MLQASLAVASFWVSRMIQRLCNPPIGVLDVPPVTQEATWAGPGGAKGDHLGIGRVRSLNLA